MASKRKKWHSVPDLIGINISKSVSNASETQPASPEVGVSDDEGVWDFADELFYRKTVCQKGKCKTKKANRDRYVISVRNTSRGTVFHLNRKLRELLLMSQSDREKSRLHHLPGPKPAPGHKDIKRFLKRLRKEAEQMETRTTNTGVQHHPLALSETNVPQYYSDDELIVELMNMQSRDLSPEDYELLLQLDSYVSAKTLSLSKFNRLSLEVVEEGENEKCCICWDEFQIGQQTRRLPCKHMFHASCIERWLLNESENCPLDGKPVNL